jgi:uncharacterized membrane protein
VTDHPARVRPAFAFAWRGVKRHWLVLLLILLTIVVAWAVLEVIVIGLEKRGMGRAYNIVLHVVYLVFQSSIDLGFLRVALLIYDGGRPTYRDFLREFRYGWAFFVAKILYLLAIAAGLALLVAPGLHLALRYSMVGLAMADGERNPIRSLRHSRHMTRGHSWRLLWFFIVVFLTNVLGAIWFGTGLLVTAPMSVLAAAFVYRRLGALQVDESAPVT